MTRLATEVGVRTGFVNRERGDGCLTRLSGDLDWLRHTVGNVEVVRQLTAVLQRHLDSFAPALAVSVAGSNFIVSIAVTVNCWGEADAAPPEAVVGLEPLVAEQATSSGSTTTQMSLQASFTGSFLVESGRARSRRSYQMP